MCHEKLHWDYRQVDGVWESVIRVMCHEKLHWDFLLFPEIITPVLSELCAMKSCTETFMGVAYAGRHLSELCAMKSCTETGTEALLILHDYQNYVPWKVALRPSTSYGPSPSISIRIMCHEKLHWDILISASTTSNRIRIMCHEKLHWDSPTIGVVLNSPVIRIMCHEKLHWDFLAKPALMFIMVRVMCHEKLHWDISWVRLKSFLWGQSYVPWKVALRRKPNHK